MKIDVEGFERKVLAGMPTTLKSGRLRASFMELHPKYLNDNRQSIGETLFMLENDGFILKELGPRKAEIHVLAVKS